MTEITLPRKAVNRISSAQLLNSKFRLTDFALREEESHHFGDRIPQPHNYIDPQKLPTTKELRAIL